MKKQTVITTSNTSTPLSNNDLTVLLMLHRIAAKANYTIGRLYVNGEYFCDTLEPTDRHLIDCLPTELQPAKVWGKTAIPRGIYRIELNTPSPKYASCEAYRFIEGKLPRLVDVPQFSGILIHIGNYPRDTEGCILVGKNDKPGCVTNSTSTFRRLMNVFRNKKGALIRII